ncbi:hypothetical protein DWU98_19340 [Dyella monticola]|uniref:Uncharacterized protein n=1 Tax=Dyella monticola TaxID=1927958 RepID=A0A370WSR1_9GAMM|nr:hypothetical protein DWU98_19340 [Dyella monticola]
MLFPELFGRKGYNIYNIRNIYFQYVFSYMRDSHRWVTSAPRMYGVARFVYRKNLSEIGDVDVVML